MKSNVNGGQLEVKLTRKGLGWIATDRFEVRQRVKNKLVIRLLSEMGGRACCSCKS